jgi:hypothetical protein
MGLYGDFNHLPIKMLTNSHPDMKQVVKDKTRGDAILDLIITNLKNRYNTPTVLAHLSDPVITNVCCSPQTQHQEGEARCSGKKDVW